MPSLIEKITAAHAQDRARVADQIVSIRELPRSFDSLTPEWLTELICRGNPSGTVTAYQLESIENCSSNGKKIHLEYNQALLESSWPATLFCKASHDLGCRIVQTVTGGSRNEAIFYNAIRPLLQIEAPRPLLARFDPRSFNSLLVLPNIDDCGGRFFNNQLSMTRINVEAQLYHLAQVHGRCYHDPKIRARLSSLPTWPDLFRSLEFIRIEELSNRGFLAAKDVIPPRTYRQFKKVWPSAVASVQRHTNLPYTLIHGDVHLRNWYVTKNGEIGLSDWETASRGHWGRDIAYVLSTSLTVEHRRSWETDLLRFYIECLRAEGGPSVSFAEAWIHYRQQQMSALVWWGLAFASVPRVLELPRGNSTLEFFRRTVVAVDDLESLSSF